MEEEVDQVLEEEFQVLIKVLSQAVLLVAAAPVAEAVAGAAVEAVDTHSDAVASSPAQ